MGPNIKSVQIISWSLSVTGDIHKFGQAQWRHLCLTDSDTLRVLCRERKGEKSDDDAAAGQWLLFATHARVELIFN